MADKFEEEHSIDSVIKLLSVYESEWEHRDNIMWSTSFKFFVAGIILCVWPYMDRFNKNINPAYLIMLPIISAAVSLIFLAISYSYSVRLTAISQTKDKLNYLLPEKYRRYNGKSKFLKYRMASWMPIFLFIVLLLADALSIIMFIKIYM